MEVEQKRLFESKAFVAGWISGILGIVSGQPFDTVKVRMQNLGISNLGSGTKGKISPIRVTTEMIKKEGPFSLFKGTISPSIGFGITNAITFGTYRYFNNFFCNLHGYSSYSDLPVMYHAMSGFVAGLACDIVTTPVELVKIQMQIQKGGKQLSNINVVRNIINSKVGFRGLYRGLCATLLRDGPAWAGYYTIAEICKRKIPIKFFRNKKLNENFTRFNSGGIGGVFAWLISFPFDTIKTKIQSFPFDSSMKGEKKKMRISQCFRQTFSSSESFRSLYSGLLPCLVRAYVVCAVIFCSYEYLIDKL